MIPRPGQYPGKGFLLPHASAQFFIQVQALHILNLGNIREISVYGSQLLSLIDERRPFQEKLYGSQQLSQRRTHSRIRIDLGYHSGIVMVFIEKGHPAAVGILLHPFHIIAFQVIQVITIVLEAGMPRRLQMIKGENHIQLMTSFSRQKLCHLHPHPRGLPHGKRIIGIKSLNPQLPQVIVQTGAVKIVLNPHIADQLPHTFVSIRQLIRFGNIVDHVQPETVHAPIQPPLHHGNHIGAHPGIVPI